MLKGTGALGKCLEMSRSGPSLLFCFMNVNVSGVLSSMVGPNHMQVGMNLKFLCWGLPAQASKDLFSAVIVKVYQS